MRQIVNQGVIIYVHEYNLKVII